MKRTVYLLATVALVAGCSQSEVLVDTETPVIQVQNNIGFDTFVNKATRAANSTALNDFYSAFNVYGWKTVGNENPTCVFNNITVSYFNADDGSGTEPSAEWGENPQTGWYYNDIRYWDKMATGYQFSAYTPTDADANCTADGVITIGTSENPVTVETANLMEDAPSATLAYSGFASDYMTAQSTESNNNNKVSLIFKHLQTKLNIRIMLDESITTAQDVSVQKIEVHNLGNKGYYASDATATGTVSGWTITEASDQYVPTAGNVYSLNATNNYNGCYVLEQLILPQTIEKADADIPSLSEYSEACIYVEYTIGGETFKSYSPLANIFTTDESYNLEGGKQYTLNITVGPKPIEFTAEVTEWAEGDDKGLDMD